MSQMTGDYEKAKEYLSLSLKQSKAINMQSGIEHAEEALKELDTETQPQGALKRSSDA